MTTDADGQNEMFEGANVSKLEDGDILASLSAWARTFGTSRETLQDRLVEANVQSKGKRQGYPLYGGREVYNAWLSGPEARVDPDSMSPFNRRAWYQGEHEKLKLQTERGELVPAIEVEQTIGKVAKLFVLGMDTAIDTIERDAGLTALQAAKLEQHFDRLRDNLYRAITDEPEQDDPVTPPEKKAPKAKAVPAGTAIEEAVAFLKKSLARGAQPTAKLVAAAKKAGISEGTLRRAKAQLGKDIVAQRQGKGWVWSTVKPKARKSRKKRKR